MSRRALAFVVLLSGLAGTCVGSLASTTNPSKQGAVNAVPSAKPTPKREKAAAKPAARQRQASASQRQLQKQPRKQLQQQAQQRKRPAPQVQAGRRPSPAVLSTTPASRAASAAAASTPALSAAQQAGLHRTPDPLSLRSSVALVVDQASGQVLFDKNAEVALPIASLTKLMTALIVLEAGQDLDEMLEITADDIDRLKNSSSRLRVGTQMSRADMLHLSLMSSENRAASALARHYPGGVPAFVGVMNSRARALGMRSTRFVDSTGLSSENVASAQDLAKLALAAYRHPLIREYSTHPRHAIEAGGHQLQYMNSNRLVMHPDWDIGLQKTGYISEAGRCLLMQTRINGRPVVMVFLDSNGKESRLGDAARVRRWLEAPSQQTMTDAGGRRS